MTNHQWSDAIDVVTDETGSGAYTVDNTTDDYLIAEDNPTGYTLVGQRAAWYTWAARETTTASASLQVSSSISGQTMTLFRNNSGTWSRIGAVKQSTGTGPLTYLPTMLQDARYYLRIADYPGLTAQGQTLYLTLTGLLVAAPGPPGNLNLPVLHSYAHIPEAFIRLPTAATTDPIRGSARLDAVIVGGGDRFDLPALIGGAHMPGALADVDDVPVDPVPVVIRLPASARSSRPLVVAPVRAAARVNASAVRRLRVVLTDPPHLSEIPVAAPVLTAIATLVEGDADDSSSYLAQFEYGTVIDGTYTTAGIVTVPFDLLLNYMPIEAQLPALQDETTYQWRVRIVIDGSERAWTDYWRFTTAIGQGIAVLPVSANITSRPTYPHLWHIEPAAGQPGDQVTIYGHGFPLSQTSVLFGDTAMQVVSWTHVDASADAASDQRYIGDDDNDPEHDEIVVVVPDVDEPGAAVTVLEGSD